MARTGIWALVACGCAGAEAPDLPTRGLVGEGVVGVIRAAEAGCGGEGLRVGLWGPTYGTRGEVPAEAVKEEPGVVWLWFPLETGLGEAQAALRLEGVQARLPLGARRGEFDVVMRIEQALPAGLDAADAASAAAVARERESWAAGAFVLQEGEAVVGELTLRGEAPPWIQVYDPTWLTPAAVQARRADEGADLLLSFPVEPAFQGEEAQIRVNAATRDVVVPAGSTPTELDRRLRMEPGRVTAEQRERAIADARAASRALEASQTGALAARLARAATSDQGCRALDQLDPSWGLLLRGYRVRVVNDAPADQDPRCVVEVEPEIVQHGRELRGRYGAEHVEP